MTGDRAKPISLFMRWVDHFGDGVYKTTRKGKSVRQVPNSQPGDEAIRTALATATGPSRHNSGVARMRTGVEIAINATKRDKRASWARLVREVKGAIKPWQCSYNDRFYKT